jgi:hypothetical protein
MFYLSNGVFLSAFSDTQSSHTQFYTHLHGHLYCNVLGVLYSRWNFIALQKSIHYS